MFFSEPHHKHQDFTKRSLTYFTHFYLPLSILQEPHPLPPNTRLCSVGQDFTKATSPILFIFYLTGSFQNPRMSKHFTFVVS